MKRISLLTAAAALAAVASCSGPPRPEGPGLVRLDDGVYAFIAEGPTAAEGLGANAGFIVGDREVLVVDSRFTPDLARGLLESIRSVTDRPVAWLVNTHYHPDHVWGNEVFRDAGARIIARPETQAEIETYTPVYLDYYRENKPDVYRLISGVSAAIPDSAADVETRMDLGGIEVVLQWFGPGHTAGDLVVSVPSRRIVFAGGLVSNGYHPNLGDQGADFDNWIETLGRMTRMKPKTIVPGQGAPGGVELIAEQNAYIVDLTDLCVEAIRKGRSLSESIMEVRLPGTEDYLQGNILPFNIQAIYRARVLDVVRPAFQIDIPDAFVVSDGGGETRAGMVQWIFQSSEGYLELEVSWGPTNRNDVILEDIHDAIARYRRGEGLYDFRIDGSKRLEIGGEDQPAAHGRWSYRTGSLTTGGGLWAWTMRLDRGTLYSIRMLTNAGNDPVLETRNIETLEAIAGTIRPRTPSLEIRRRAS